MNTLTLSRDSLDDIQIQTDIFNQQQGRPRRPHEKRILMVDPIELSRLLVRRTQIQSLHMHTSFAEISQENLHHWMPGTPY
jgi:hypothetical protein